MQFTRISTRQISTQDNLTNTKMPTILAMAKVSLSSVTQKPKTVSFIKKHSHKIRT